MVDELRDGFDALAQLGDNCDATTQMREVDTRSEVSDAQMLAEHEAREIDNEVGPDPY